MTQPTGFTDEQFKEYMNYVRQRDREAGSRGAFNTGAGSGNTGEWLNSITGPITRAFGDTASAVMKGGQQLVEGTLTVRTSVDTLTPLIGKFGLVGSIAADTLRGAANVVGEMNDSLKRTSAVGLTFGNNIGRYNELVKGAYLTLPEFEQAIKQNASYLVGMGGNVNNAAKNFLQLQAAVVSSELGEHLMMAGVSSQQLAEASTVATMNLRGVAKMDLAQRAELAASMGNMALQFDDLARITGKNKEAMMQQTKSALNKAEVDSGLAMKGQTYHIGARAAAASVADQEDVQKLMLKTLADAKYDADDIKVMGNLSKDAQKAMFDGKRMLTEAEKTGNKELYNQALEKLKSVGTLQAAYYQGEEGRMRANKTGDAVTQRMYTAANAQGMALLEERERLAKIENEKRRAAGQAEITALDIKETDAKESLIKENRLNAKGQFIDPKTGVVNKDPGAVVTEAMRGLDLLGKQGTSIAAKGLSDFNKSLGTSGGELNKFNEMLKKLNINNNLVPVMQAPLNPGGRAGGTAANATSNGLPVREEAEGSKDVWGSWFGGPPGLANIREAGPEAVVPFGKMDEFFGDMVKQAPGMLKEFQSQMPEMQKGLNEAITKGAPQLNQGMNQAMGMLNQMMSGGGPAGMPNFNNILSGITKNVSSVSNGFTPPKLDIPQPKGADLKQTAPAPTPAPAPMPAFAPPPQLNVQEMQKDLAMGIDQLNKQMATLIHFAEETAKHTENTSRGVKAGGNRLAP